LTQYKKILVVCPAGAVTGGPEALHQLVAHMNTLGLAAYMCYLPFKGYTNAPQPYEHYKTKSTFYEDVPGNLIIFPEVYPMLALKVKYAQAAIWWLSLENFLERRHVFPLHDKIRYLKRVIQGRRPWGGGKALKKIIHFSQTEHSSEYLRSCDINPIPLIDSINEDFLTDRYLQRIDHKENIILYNPTKGWKVTRELINANPDWKFEPLKNLNQAKLSEKLFNAKLYIDFGHHPGRDRLPREAVMHGCCLITGKLGSARNDIDIPIPHKYKLDTNTIFFIEQFRCITSEIMENFPEQYKNFISYRRWLQDEPRVFKEQIHKFFIEDSTF